MARKNPFEAEIAASLRNQFRWQHSRLPDAIMGRGVQRPFDFLLLLPYRAVGIEAKQTKNRTSFSLSSLSPHQHENLALVSALNHEAYVAINFRDHHSPRLNEAYLIPYYDLVKAVQATGKKSITRKRLKEIGTELKRIKIKGKEWGWDFQKVLKGGYMRKAIPTFYKGMAYRSRLEAATAQLLDVMGMETIYEAFSILLSGGIFYQPDFFVEEQGLWVEARGYEKRGSEQQLQEFALQLSSEEKMVRVSPDKVGGVCMWEEGEWKSVTILVEKEGARFVVGKEGLPIRVKKSTIQIKCGNRWVDPETALRYARKDS